MGCEYVVRVVERQTYLSHGREVSDPSAATHYPTPSHARVAADGFLRRTPRVQTEIVETKREYA